MPSTTNNGQLLGYDIFWLRDTCRCEKCYHAGMSERNCTVLSMPEDLDVANYKLDGKTLLVEWSDGHESTYDMDFLSKFKLENYNTPKTEMVLWNRKSFEHHMNNNCRVAASDLMISEETCKTALGMLATYGVVFIDGVMPTEMNTEFITRQLFPIQRTFFGENCWVISNYNREHKDSAYVDTYLGPHAEHAYFCDPAGAQVFHCIKHDGEGGESHLIDGFYVADKIRREHPETFERLCTVPITFEYMEEGRHHMHTSPFFILDPITKQIKQIRYNNNDRTPHLPLTNTKDIRQFYDDLRIFTREMEALENRMILKLKPGTVIMFDNWRILHGRYGFTGKRAMVGIYVARTEYESKLRLNGFIH